MSEAIENRIVEMQFDNKDFEKNAQQTLDTLDELKKSLDFDAASKNLQNFGKAASNIDLTALQSSVDKIRDRFSAAGIAGMEVIQRLTSFAVDAGIKIANVLSKPMHTVFSGGWQRAMNIEDAKFQLEGLGVAWDSIKDDINYGVESTAYGLDAAAKAASQLVASGVQVGDAMKGALRGISGVAAMANSSYEEISPIFTTVAGQGKLMTMQMRQLESRGLNVAASMADVFTKINKGTIEVDESVASSIKNLTNGAAVTEQTVRDLVSKGKIGFAEFSTAMDQAFGEHAKDANKTFTGALSNVNAALKKIGAEFATPFIHNAIPVLNEVRLLINGIKKNMPGVFEFFSKIMSFVSATAVNNIAKAVDFLNNKFTGLTNINNGLKNILTALTRVIAAVKSAFMAVFPPSDKFGNAINSAAEGFENLTEALIPSDKALVVIRNVLVAVFSVLKGVGSVIKVIATVIGKLASVLLKIASVIVGFISSLVAVGTHLVTHNKLAESIAEKGGLVKVVIEKVKSAFEKFTSILNDNNSVLGKIASTIKTVASIIAGVIGGAVFTAINKITSLFSDLMSGKLNVFDYLKNKVSDFKTKIIDALKYLKQFPATAKAAGVLFNVFKGIDEIFHTVTKSFEGFFEGLKFDGSIIDFFKSLIDRLRESFDKLFGQLKNTSAFQGIKDLFNKLKEMPIVSTAIENFSYLIDKIKIGFTTLVNIVKKFFSTLTSNSSGGKSPVRPLADDLSFAEKVANALLNILKAIGMVVGGAIAGVVGVFNTIVSFIRSMNLDKIFMSIKDFVGRIKDLHLIQTAIDAFKNSGGNLLEVIKALAGKFKELFGILGDAGHGIFDFFAEKISNLVKKIADFFSGFSASADKMSGASSKFSSTLDKIKGKFGSFGDTASAALEKVRESGLLTKILMVAYVLAILRALVKIPTAIGNIAKSISGSNGLIGSITGLAKNASSFMDVLKGNLLEGRTLIGSLKTAVEQWGKAQKRSGLEAIPAIIRNIAISIAILAASMAALAMVPSEKLIPAATALGIFAGVLIAIAIAMSVLSKNPVSDYYFKAFAANMLSMAIAIAIITASIATIALLSDKVDTPGALKTLGVIAAIMLSISLVMMLLSKLDLTGATLRSALYLVAFATSIAIVAASFNKVAKAFMNPRALLGLKPAILAMISIIGLFAVASLIASRIKPASVLAIAGLALIFSYVLRTLTSVLTDTTLVMLGKGLMAFKDQIAAIIIATVAIMGAVEIAIALINAMILKTVATMGKGIALAGLAFMEIGVGLAFMAAAFVKLSELDLFADGGNKLKNLLLSLFIISLIFVAVVALSQKAQETSANLIKVSGALTLLAAALLLILLASKLAKNVEWTGILKALVMLVVMTGLMIAVAVAVQQGGASLKFGAIMGMVFGMIALFGMLLILGVMCDNDKTFLNLLKALGIVVGIMLSIAAVLAAAGKIRTGQSWKPILMTLLMLGTIFAGLFFLSQNIHDINDIIGLALIAAIVVGVIAALFTLLEAFLTFSKKADLGRSKAASKAMIAFAILIGGFAVISGSLIVLDKFVNLGAGLIGKIGIVIALLGMLMGLTMTMLTVSKSMNADTSGLIKMGSVMAGLTIAMLAIVGVLAVLDQLSLDNGLAAKAGILSGVFFELSLVTLAFGTIGKADKDTFKAIAALGLMIGLFAVLSIVFKLLDGLQLEGMIAKSQILMLALAELAGIQILVGKLGDLKGLIGIAGLALMIGLFGVLAIVFRLVAALPLDGILAKSQIIMLALTELAAIYIIMGFLGANMLMGLVGVAGLALMVAVFAALTLVFFAINALPVEGILPKSQIIMLVLAELTALLAVMGMLGANMVLGLIGVAGLALMTVIFGMLTLVFFAINALPIEGILAKSQIIMLVLVELVAIMVILGVPAVAAFAALGAVVTIGLALMVAVFGLLSVICLLISAIPLEGFLAKTQIVMLVLVELVAIMIILGIPVVAAFAALGGLVTIALALMVVVFGLLALVCKLIVSEIPLDGLLAKTQILVLTLFELATIMALMGLISPLAIAAVVGLPALLSLILGLAAITAAILLLKDQNPQQMREIVDVLVEALYKIIDVIKYLGDTGVGALFMVSLGIGAIGVACLIAAVAVDALSIAFVAFSVSLMALSPQIVVFFNSIATGITNACNAISASIMQTGTTIVMTVTMVITGIITAIFGGISMIMSAGSMMGTGLVDGFSTSAMEIIKVPADIISAVVAGLAGAATQLWNAGVEMGGKLVSGFRQATGWHSPPEFLVKFFKDAGVAVNENAQGVTDLFENTGETWGSAMSKAIGNKFQSFDFFGLGKGGIDGIIKGFMSDMPQLKELAGNIGNLFNMGGYGNLSAQGYQTSQSQFIDQLESRKRGLMKERELYKSEGAGGSKASAAQNKVLTGQIESINGQLEILQKQTGLATTANDKFTDSLNAEADAFGNVGKGAGGASSSIEDFESKLTSTLEGQMDIFSKFEEKSAMSKSELLSNMRSQIEGMTKWAANMETLAAKGIDQGLYEKLAMMGPQGAEYVGAFLEMTSEELAQANQMWGQSLQLPSAVAKRVTASFNNIGQNTMIGWQNGVKAEGQAVVDLYGQVGQDSVDKAGQVTGCNSPSVIFFAIGAYCMIGLRDGIKSKASLPIDAIKFICNQIVSDARKILDPSDFYSISVNLINGLTEGLSDKDALEALTAKLQWLATYIKSAEEEPNKIESPSKVWRDEIGKNLVLGLAEGLEKYAPEAVGSAEYLAEETLDAMKTTIAGIAKNLLEDDEFTPVITPVLDLTSVTNDARKLNSILSTNRAMSTMVSVDGDLQNGQQTSKFGTTFIQNNYSPKALNRIEIYRQTRNQFAQYREAMR